jgi:hypothetical protein
MKLMLYIKADSNDADYITTFEEVSIKKLLELESIFKVIKNLTAKRKNKFGQFDNWCTSQYARSESPEELYEDLLSKEQINMFHNYAPHGEYGIHTIKEIKLLKVTNETNYL